MSYRMPFKEIHIEPNANDRISEKIKDIPRINKERPCKNCMHYNPYKLIHCRLSLGNCNFYHSAYKPISSSDQMG